MGLLSASSLDALSHREMDVVRLAAKGQTDLNICRRLEIAPGTLGTYWSRIRAKTNMNSRAELAAAYARLRCQRLLLKTVQLVAEGVSTQTGPPCQKLEDVFGSLPVAAMVVDSRGSVLAATSAFADLVRPLKPHKSRIADFVSSPDALCLERSLREAIGRQEGCRVSAALVAPGGNTPCDWYARGISGPLPRALLVVSESVLRPSRSPARIT